MLHLKGRRSKSMLLTHLLLVLVLAGVGLKVLTKEAFVSAGAARALDIVVSTAGKHATIPSATMQSDLLDSSILSSEAVIKEIPSNMVIAGGVALLVLAVLAAVGSQAFGSDDESGDEKLEAAVDKQQDQAGALEKAVSDMEKYMQARINEEQGINKQLRAEMEQLNAQVTAAQDAYNRASNEMGFP
mmetsp:Transcript_8207/g.9090  ORF Transcript_8207/g.9090 Transcript_8207/m.9090 type:complete len:187 (-) Transcript_8207:7-567(-)